MKSAALIGYGLAGSVFHAPLIGATPGLGIGLIVTANPRRAAAAARAWPKAEIEASSEAVWDRAEELDFVVVATPNDSHLPLARRALERGLPVVVDKPLAPTVGEARELVELSAAAAVPLTVFHNRRWDSEFLTLRRLTGDGRLGEVMRFESRFERWRPQVEAEAWRLASTPESGGGVLLDLGTHLVDQALALFGPADAVRGAVDHRRGLEADDDAFVEIRHASGVISQLWASTVTPAPGPRMRVLGTEAAFVVERGDQQEDALREGLRPGAGWGRVPREDWGALIRGQEVTAIEPEPGAWPEFYRAYEASLREGAPPPVDPADAVTVLDVLWRARHT